MTKQIEEELNLPSLEEALAKLENGDELTEQVHDQIDSVKELRNSLQNIRVNSSSMDDSAIDEIKEKALESYKDMFDAGFNCDSKHASNFLEPAVQALSIAMEGENLKLKKKLEFYKLKQQDERLELMRRKLELEEKRAGLNVEVYDENSVVMDRNDLLERLFKEGKIDK